MKKIRKILLVLYMFVGVLSGIVSLMYNLLKTLKNEKAYILRAAFYQPAVVLVIWILILFQVDILEKICGSSWGGVLIGILIYFLEVIILAIAINSIVELIFHLKGKAGEYGRIVKLQDCLHNYMFNIVSLVALFVSSMPVNNQTRNFELFSIGVIYFISMVVSHIYKIHVHDKGIVEIWAENIQKIMENA